MARVEAWTADGRRHSDVEVILPCGVRVAIELQCSEITDTEWVARHEDYVRAGITDVWLWHPRLQVPRVVFQYDQPSWYLDLEVGKIGLHHAQPDPATVRATSEPQGCGLVHSPPCPEDRLATLWMPLQSARLTWHGIELPAEVTAELARLGGEDAAGNSPRGKPGQPPPAVHARTWLVLPRRPPVTESADVRRENCQLRREHKTPPVCRRRRIGLLRVSPHTL